MSAPDARRLLFLLKVLEEVRREVDQMRKKKSPIWWMLASGPLDRANDRIGGAMSALEEVAAAVALEELKKGGAA